MSQQPSESWLGSLSEILNGPLPGTEPQAPEAETAGPPEVSSDDDDDDTLLDRITEIFSTPLRGRRQTR